MITIFTIPRAFTGEFAYIQRNALRSWLLLEPTPEILLFGAEDGVWEAAQELGGLPVYLVERNERGTPLISDALNKARDLARNDILVMANCDNLYLGDFIPAVRACARSFPRFLMIGQRWDMRISGLLAFRPGWEALFRNRLTDLHGKAAIDYLVFRDGGWWADIPPFAVGRSAYDNWMVATTKTAGVPVVDATARATVIHQDHAVRSPRHGIEGRKNRRMYEGAGRGGTGQSDWRFAGWNT